MTTTENNAKHAESTALRSSSPATAATSATACSSVSECTASSSCAMSRPPAKGAASSVEPRLESMAELEAIVADYLQTATRPGFVPMVSRTVLAIRYSREPSRWVALAARSRVLRPSDPSSLLQPAAAATGIKTATDHSAARTVWARRARR